MGYSDNPYNSQEGIKLLEDIYDLMWVRPEMGSGAIEKNNLTRQVDHYRSNIINIVNKMRKFVSGYQQIPISETQSSGIHVCPHCSRRDFIYHWEVLDGGHYSTPLSWVSSVEPSQWGAGNAVQNGRYLWMLRYKCNNVTTCKDCYLTVPGHYSSCKACGSSEVSKAGCGKESYAKHFVQEYQFDDNHPTDQQMRDNVIQRNRLVRNPSNRREKKEGTLVRYELFHEKMPDGYVATTATQIKKYVPFVRFTYEFAGGRETREYPVSELNYALNKRYVRECRMGKKSTEGNYAHATSKPFRIAENKDSCPQCGASSYPPLNDVVGIFYPAKLMRIRAPQPLSASGGLSVKGMPVYEMLLDCKDDVDYKLALPLPAVETLMAIPDAPEPQVASVGITVCPNDVGSSVVQGIIVEEMRDEVKDLQDGLDERLQNLMGLGPADQVTSQGYSFVVCEGRSRKAFYDADQEMWIDESPPCTGYGKTYPRWNIADPLLAEPYLGPNPKSHMVQDFLKCSDNLMAFSASGPPSFHTIEAIGTRVIEELGRQVITYECRTCRGIVDKGGVLQYRESLGQCDSLGQALNGFPQEVLDAEISYEDRFPKVNEDGEPVPTAWGIVASRDHNGKQMLEKKLSYKVI